MLCSFVNTLLEILFNLLELVSPSLACDVVVPLDNFLDEALGCGNKSIKC